MGCRWSRELVSLSKLESAGSIHFGRVSTGSTVCSAPTTAHWRLKGGPATHSHFPVVLATMSVLITGANGRTSRHVISALLSSTKCPPLRLLVHSQSSQHKLGSTFPQLLSAPHSIIIADYLKPSTLTPAFDGISTVFHNGPAFLKSEVVMGIAVIDAAKESGLNPHVIFCSILHPMRTKLLDHKAKLT